MKLRFLPLLAALALATSVCAQDETTTVATATAVTAPVTGIAWDAANAVYVADGTYGRMIRLKDNALLCSFESKGRSYVKRSTDEGKTWGRAVVVRQIEGVSASNPELLQLKNGRVCLFYNGRPTDGFQKYSIGVCFSDDNGLTWTPREDPIFEAGTEAGVGCWEPAAIQRASGEIQVLFANEFPFPDNNDQEISVVRSIDNGNSWQPAQRVAYRAGHRDGMPVPLALQDGQTIVVAIEDNGLTPGNVLQPAVLASPAYENWKGVIDGKSPNRWAAPPFERGVYGGAPYIAQLPSGETLLSTQSKEGGRKEAQMVVYIGDAAAKNFGKKSVPVELPADVAGSWNSIFVKDAETVTALTATTIEGKRGLWAIDGKVQR